MDKPSRYKAKQKKTSPKPKNPKKKRSDGPTCSMFLSEISKRLAQRKRQEEESPKNIVHTIIDSITNALPVVFSRKTTPPKAESPIRIETLRDFAPELMPNDTLDVSREANITIQDADVLMTEVHAVPTKKTFKIPKMPVVTSEVLKQAQRRIVVTEDVAVNTGADHDVASELARHVGTLKKISLIAEEFNQKTAKNLKEIVDSVQEDLVKKLEEIQAEQKPLEMKTDDPMQVDLDTEKATTTK